MARQRERLLPDKARLRIDMPGEKPYFDYHERILPSQGSREQWMNKLLEETAKKNAEAQAEQRDWVYSIEFKLCPFNYEVERTYISPGERVFVILPYSEINMHMEIAGEIGEIELLPDRLAAQIYIGGRPYSAPVLPSEAGVFEDREGQYVYALYFVDED